MANLLGADGALSYKGILNLDATTINTPLDTTLRAVTDGMGTASPLQLSTTQVALSASNPVFLFNGTNGAGAARNWGIALNQSVNGDFAISYSSANGTSALANEALVIKNTGSINIGGTFTNAARLHVRGDGTNPIARFEDNSGNAAVFIGNNRRVNFEDINVAFYRSGNGFILGLRGDNTNGTNFLVQTQSTVNLLSGTSTVLGVSSNMASAAGSANFRPFEITYTINNSGAQSGTATGIFLNATETALNGMTHNLMDLQVGGSSKIKGDRTGLITLSNGIRQDQVDWLKFSGDYGFKFSSISGTQQFLMDSAGFQLSATYRILWGTTNASPAIKRNSAAIDFRLADDSDYCNVVCGRITGTTGGIIGGNAGVALGIAYNGALVGSASFYGFASTATSSGTMDSNFSRISAGLIGVGTGVTSNVLGGLSLSRIIASGLPTTRPSTVGEFYQDTAANILANGDKVVGIRQ